MVDYERQRVEADEERVEQAFEGEVTFFGTMLIELEFETESNGSSIKSLSQTFESRESQIAKDVTTN